MAWYDMMCARIDCVLRSDAVSVALCYICNVCVVYLCLTISYIETLLLLLLFSFLDKMDCRSA